MAQPRLFLLDSMALLYRAHFVFINNPRITSTGLNTSAVYGFANTLFDVLQNQQPTHIAAAFDSEAPTFRHDSYAEYKANRQETPEDILAALPYVHRLLDALDIPVLVRDGFEADDLIGTLAWKAAAEGFRVYMMTMDKDYAQLVRDNVYLYRVRTHGRKPEVMDRAAVIEKFGVTPEQIPDFLGLMGDSSDNIPGVPKIGEKTARSLLQEYASVDELLENVNNITKASIRESLQENREQARQSRELATIHTDMDLSLVPEKLVSGGWNRDELAALFQELEFRTLSKRVLGEGLFAHAPSEAPEEDDDVAPTKPETFQDRPIDFQVLEEPEAIAGFAGFLSGLDSFAFDTETTSLEAVRADLVGLSISWAEGKAAYIPFPADFAAAKERLFLLAAPFADEGIEKSGQNLKYDLTVLRRYGLEAGGALYDTMIAHYVVHAASPHGLDQLAEHYLNYAPLPIEALIGNKGKGQKSMREVPLEQIAPYAAEDAELVVRLRPKLDQEVRAYGVETLLSEVELPLVRVLMRMEHNGIRLDTDALAELSKELARDIQQVQERIWAQAGEEFNVGSPKQLGEVIYDKLQLGKPKKTRTGQYATDERVLTKLAEAGHELPALVLDYRSLSKLKNTYVDALPELVNPETGLVHTSYNQAVAVTGRLSSNNPNLQNIPIRTERGREIRKAFVPREADWVLLSADYSQIELRILASLSQDAHLLEAFRDGQDIHRTTAAKVFKVAREEVSSEQRRRAKIVNFGMIYGITPYGIAERLGIPQSGAKAIHAEFFRQFPTVRAFMDACIEQAREAGYVSTLMGRRHSLPQINSGNRTQREYAERNAINTPIQGTAADMIKLAMIRLDEALQAGGFAAKPCLQVHDELVLDVPEAELEAVQPVVKQAMEEALPLEGVPVEVELGTGRNWLAAH